MGDLKVSAWARPFVAGESDAPEAERPALDQMISSQQSARVSLRHWKTTATRYAIGFAILLSIAMVPGPAAWFRDVAFILAVFYGAMAISRYMKVSECRAEIATDLAQFLD